MSDSISLIACDHVGVNGTTDVAVKQITPDLYEARVGIAIMGYCDFEWLDAHPDATPFDSDFPDNYAVGSGPTRESALIALRTSIREMSESLWAT